MKRARLKNPGWFLLKCFMLTVFLTCTTLVLFSKRTDVTDLAWPIWFVSFGMCIFMAGRK